MKVFLGGTCNGPDWREYVIPKLTIDYFNPVVDDWNASAQKKEEKEKLESDIRLYVITPYMTGVYSIAEAVQDSNKYPHKTVLCVLDNFQGEYFDKSQLKSLEAVCNLVKMNGSIVLTSLDAVIYTLNNFKTLSSLDMTKYHPVFIDTEFTDLKQRCKLISIGITDNEDNTFYAESNVFNENECSQWVRDNILHTLEFNNEYRKLDKVERRYKCKGSIDEIRYKLMTWFSLISKGKQILVISDCLAYDWVLFAELIKDSNGNFPSDKVFYVPVDIMGILVARGLDIDIHREDLVDIDDNNKHNSLHDAEVIKRIWQKYS